MWEKLEELKHAKFTSKFNYLLIPVTTFGFNDEDIEKFNEIYHFLLKSNFKKILRSEKGTILYDNSYNMPCYDINNTKTCLELTILTFEGFWRIQFRTKLQGKRLSGRACFTKLKKELEKDGIDIAKYYIDNGEEVKTEIESPMIDINNENFINKTINGVHHVDFHSSYPAGLANAYPEFRKTLERLYLNRHKKESYKAILNLSIGFFQSKIFGYKLAHLAKAAILDNNERIKDLAKRIYDSGNVIISYNTDGIWYYGNIFHSSKGDEGEGLGQWSHDHINCKIRFKSKGAYEFIENGVYTPVVRGHTNLDKVKPREEWNWGDIYKAEAKIKKCIFIEGKGIVEYEDSEIEEL